MNTYLITYSDQLGTQEAVAKVIDNISEIADWRYDMQNCIYLKSMYSAVYLAEKIREKIPKGRFIIADISNNSMRNGYLTPETWNFIKNK